MDTAQRYKRLQDDQSENDDSEGRAKARVNKHVTVTSSIALRVSEMETSVYGEKANGGLLGEGQAGDIREAGVVSGCGANVCHP